MDEINTYLSELKDNGFSAPAGIYWSRLNRILIRKSKISVEEKLPSPLILGGDMVSHAVKHERLREQLVWAQKHHCLEEGLEYLNKLPAEHWNISSGNDWYTEHPGLFDEE